MTKEELEKENKDLHDNYEQYKAVAEPEIAALKNEIVNLKGVIKSLSEQRDALEKEKCELLGIIQSKDKAIADLKKENAELKMGLKWDAGNRDELLKENAELRTKVTALENANRAMVKELDDTTSGGLSVLKNVVRSKEQLTKAKEIIKDYMIVVDNITVCGVPEENRCINVLKLNEQAEQFINSDVEK